MPNNMNFFGAIYNNVSGIKVKDINGVTHTFTEGTGTLPITENGTYDVTNYASADVSVSGGTVEEAPDNDVIFIDYDGTRLYSYSAQEFANLSALPSNPTHTGLTAQGWNWTLADAKTYVAKYGMLVIGQHYVTDDGKTRIYITIGRHTPSSERTMKVRFKSSTANNTTVDWGDGTTETKGSTTATNYSHTYTDTGDYVITLKVNSGTISFDGTSGTTGYSIYGGRNTNSENYWRRYYITRIELGSSANLGNYGLYTLPNCEAITIPSNCTVSGQYSINGLTRTRGIVLPLNAQVGVGSCGNARYVAIPKTVTGGDLASCSSLLKVCFTHTTMDCNGCARLQQAVINENSTTLGLRIFQNTYMLTSITIPSGITTIGQQVFNNCYALREIHIKPTTPPTLENTNAFGNVSSDCVFYVPSAKLSDYQTASNWSTYASRMVGE